MRTSRDPAENPPNWSQVEKLYLEHRHVAHQAAVWFLGSRAADADDVLHTAMLKAAYKIHTLEDPAKAKTWLLRIVRNTAYDHLRAQKRRWAWQRPLESFDDRQLASFITSRSANPAQAAILVLAMSFVESLPSKQRDAFLLYHYFGLERDEIAIILGCKPATVTTHLGRAAAKAARAFPPDHLISRVGHPHLGRSTS
jgi:RNA polymerase sigma-70 factor, ECF subfamily